MKRRKVLCSIFIVYKWPLGFDLTTFNFFFNDITRNPTPSGHTQITKDLKLTLDILGVVMSEAIIF